MKRLSIGMFFLLVMGCYHEPHVLYDKEVLFNSRRHIIVPETVTLNIYWEWAEMQVNMQSLYFLKDWTITAEMLKSGMEEGTDEKMVRNSFCNNSLRKEGERIYLDSTNATVNAECLYPMETRSHYRKDPIDFVLDYVLSRPNSIVIRDGEYKLFYYGDILLVTEGNFIRHEKVDPVSYENLRSEFGDEWPCSRVCDGIPYEIVFPLDAPVYSLTVLTHPKDLAGYKPLELDTAMLPIESPGYKKLREYGN